MSVIADLFYFFIVSRGFDILAFISNFIHSEVQTSVSQSKQIFLLLIYWFPAADTVLTKR